MKISKILVKTKSKSYPVYVGNGILSSAGILIKKNVPNAKKISIICDKGVPSRLLKKLQKSLRKFNPKTYKFLANEKSKNFKTINKMVEILLKDNLSRSDCVVAFGGGIIGDITAFASSITKRGIKFINIPTTLLAQVDSSIGGKTGANSNYGKNLIGTFYQPEFVLTDVSTLNSLSKRQIICGYGEILKHSLILDKKFFLWLSKNAGLIINNKNNKILKSAIIKSCMIKSKVVSRDENEKDLRKILNFGHTFAHGFEAAKNFSNKLNHGEAVLLGMITAAELSYMKKLLNKKDLKLIKKHYLNFSLPYKVSKFFKRKEIEKISQFMKRDKKNISDKINLILIKKIGKIVEPNKINLKVFEIKKFLRKAYN